MKNNTHQDYIDSITPHVSGSDRMYLNLLKRLLIGMEALENSLSIIIQGPLNERMKKSIPIYLKLIKQNQHLQKYDGSTMGNLVISYWDIDDESIISEFKNEDNITFIKNTYSDLPEENRRFKKSGSRGCAPWILQNITTYEGLKACTGYLSIKVRSDEIYPELSVFHKGVKKDLRKTHTSDIFFRSDAVEKFHISDHVIGGTTKSLKEGFKMAVNMCKSNNRKGMKFPEQLICRAILKSKWINCDKEWKSKEIMKKYFNIIPISTMPSTIWTCSYRGYRELRKIESGWLQNIEDI